MLQITIQVISENLHSYECTQSPCTFPAAFVSDCHVRNLRGAVGEILMLKSLVDRLECNPGRSSLVTSAVQAV
jgi:hypothetical protein